MKKLACVSILAFSFLTLASAAKSYHIVLAGPAKVGNLELKAGNYAVKVDGANAVFTRENTDKSFSAPVKVENAGRKIAETTVESTTASGENVVQDIQLGGTGTQLDFSY
jgi:hypothetical protein